VSNAVFRVEASDGLFVLKQSRPQLATADPWFSDVSRVFRELEVMKMLHPLLPSLAVPEVLHEDRDNFAFLMAHAPEPSRNWREMLLGREVDPNLGEEAGRLLGRMHSETWLRDDRIEPFRDATVFRQLRTEPFYERVRQKHPDLSEMVDALIRELETFTDALCHGDFSPKNLLIHRRGLTLVDYETAHAGCFYMDLGFFLSHLLLKAIKHPDLSPTFFELTRRFWTGYSVEFPFKPSPIGPTILHCGVCLLARVDGTSPAPYLTEPAKRDAVRRLGRRVLQGPITHWEDVLAAAEDECRSLT
jgi:5-methylthioribose kinase